MLISFLLDVMYPPTCLACAEEGAWVCSACLARVPFFSHEDTFVVLGYYGHPLLRILLTRLKYQAATCVLPSLTELLRRFRLERHAAWPWAGEGQLALVAVPSDRERSRCRGIDHAVCLEELVFCELVPWAQRSNILRRKKRVHQNAHLPRNQLREVNVRGVFEVSEPIEGAILLVDDVYTTGATWNEAARVLLEAGASRVYGFVFAKG